MVLCMTSVVCVRNDVGFSLLIKFYHSQCGYRIEARVKLKKSYDGLCLKQLPRQEWRNINLHNDCSYNMYNINDKEHHLCKNLVNPLPQRDTI